MHFEKLLTETRNLSTLHIDSQSSLGIVELINQEDHTVATAVQAILQDIAKAVDLIVAALQAGGRLFYLGAGTSGRLGILDASECPPTYGTDPSLIIGLIAGGPPAVFRAVEGAEDSLVLAKEDLHAKSLQQSDIVVGVAASGQTPYVIGGLQYAKSLGCQTISLSCTPDSELGRIANLSLTVLTGPEVIMGSTRMKAGTAQKMVLNMLTTATMISLGKVYSNLMVDLQATNVKLKERAKRIVALAAGVSLDQAETALTAAGGSAKLAIVMVLTNVPAAEAAQLLQQAGGFVSKAKDKRGNEMFNKIFNRFSPELSPAAVEAGTAVQVYAPIDGRVIPLEQVADPVFSQKMLGDGMAIEPASSQILSPFDGTVVAAFPTGHAIGLRSLIGLECLIHVGIDTVTLNGRGFRLLVKQDQTVTQGTPLIELDLSVLHSSGKDLVTPLVITNSEDWKIEQRWDKPTIAAGKQLLFVARPANKAAR